MSWLSSGVNKVTGGSLDSGSQSIQDTLGIGNDDQKKKLADAQAKNQEQYQKTLPYLDQMSQNETSNLGAIKQDTKDYQATRNHDVQPYLNELDRLGSEATDQATSAQKTYTNTIQPAQQNIMDAAAKQAGSAMSLADAGDPNNSVAKAVRALYDQQATAEGNRGKADYGILASLGSQATANQLGGMGAVTGSNLQLLNSQNQSQASQAYTNAQQRMSSLRDQGLNQGFAQSAAQYDRGVNATHDYSTDVANYQNGLNNNISQQQSLRGEQQGYGGEYSGIRQGIASEDYGINQGIDNTQLGYQQGAINRQLGAMGDYYGTTQQNISNSIAQDNASNAAQQGIVLGAGNIAANVLGGANAKKSSSAA